MASTFKKKQKRNFIVALVCCVLVTALILATVIVAVIHRSSLYAKFKDKDFASAIASALELSSHYDLTQEDLDKYEGIVYFASIGVTGGSSSSSILGTSSSAQPYAYPIVRLCDKAYTDYMIAENDPEHDHDDSAEATFDPTGHYLDVLYIINEAVDLNNFRNLRLLHAFDPGEIYQMLSGSYQTYSTSNPISLDTVISTMSLSGLTDLDQISGLNKLEHLSLCYTGVTNLNGLKNFPNLTKLDISETQVKDISGLEYVPELRSLQMSALNYTAPETEEETSSEASSAVTSDETSSESSEASEADETSAETSVESVEASSEASEASSEEKDESSAAEKEPSYSETGLKSEQLAVLSKLTKLVRLNISNNFVDDLSSLKGITTLKYLYIQSNPIKNLNGLQNSKGLTVLQASDCRLENIDALEGFEKLENVTLTGNKLTTLAPLSKASAMKSLDASENKLTDADAVSVMKDLESLVLSSNELTKAPDLSALTVVTSVNLSENKLSDVSGLEKFNPTKHELKKDSDGKETPATVTLNLSKNEITAIKLTATKLTSLNLSENKLGKDVEGAALSFEGCTGITTLDISKNDTLKDATGIETLTKLATLTANECGLEELPALKELKDLTTINLTKNKSLKNVNGVADTEKLATLTLTDCSELTDLTGIANVKTLKTLTLTNCTKLDDDSIAKAFGTVKLDEDGKVIESENVLVLTDKDISMKIDMKGCTGIKNFDIFDKKVYKNITCDHSEVKSEEK